MNSASTSFLLNKGHIRIPRQSCSPSKHPRRMSMLALTLFFSRTIRSLPSLSQTVSSLGQETVILEKV
ncbi:hypothetical protein BDV40DRAFT_262384 [Aspergillus tamarii]|uniref:Uncharacterized protein n=1 Tax=Aspergillus tamarii TaxID=41984 RepID=A0A5N6UYN5_ASPTM|nr:hypothetical protein BDV40DRAFT_262384 [Aspergillus tamarii]